MDDNNNLLSSFYNFKKTGGLTKREFNDSILLVDGTNMFLRSWAANPKVDSNGEFIGGVVGFLKSIGNVSFLTKPTRIILVFDGKGGSHKRKAKFSGYKSGRSSLKKKSDYNTLTSEEEIKQNMLEQFEKLIYFIKMLPMKIMIIDNIEADDVIAYITTTLADKHITILSADNDYLQLINENVSIYSPHKKIIIGKDKFKELYGFESYNHIWYKIILGDTGDKVPGVKGIGKKTISILYEFLNQQPYKNVDDFIEKINIYLNTKSEDISYKKLVKIVNIFNNSIDQMKLGFELMQLSDVDISGDSKQAIISMFRGKINELNIQQFRSNMLKYSNDFDYNSVENWYKKNFQSLLKN